jgi:hypothetical protein
MDTMDEVSDGTAREQFTGLYLDLSRNLAKVRVAGSNPVVRSKISEGPHLRRGRPHGSRCPPI